MSKYQSTDSVVVKRSSVVGGNWFSKGLAGKFGSKSKGTSDLRKSMSQAITSLDKVLQESDKIMPRTQNSFNSNKV